MTINWCEKNSNLESSLLGSFLKSWLRNMISIIPTSDEMFDTKSGF